MDSTERGAWRRIETASLIVGPALMSVGDLFHPAESADPATQIAFVAEAPAAWYGAHLFLLIGMLLFVPGILVLTRLAAARRPAMGYAARVLILVSVGSLSAVFAFEMLLGRFLSGGADLATGVALLQTFQSPQVFLALLPGLLGFFVGTALLVIPLAESAGPFRWPALGFAVGAALILAEILLAKVLLSQIGNVMIFCACASFAWLLLRDKEEATTHHS